MTLLASYALPSALSFWLRPVEPREDVSGHFDHILLAHLICLASPRQDCSDQSSCNQLGGIASDRPRVLHDESPLNLPRGESAKINATGRFYFHARTTTEQANSPAKMAGATTSSRRIFCERT